ncbi:MAG: DUF2461 domain-containing protein [Lacrimispora sp.]|uniref:DUF2461 domain-containing protein n=1 Tax=Lacrimispora sp. TaxID=2719234 RepID=UPI0039E2E8A1
MDIEKMMKFLSDLEKNNSFEWMAQNKKEYQISRDIFIQLVQELILCVAEVDHSIAYLEARDLIFKLNRDTRFGKDKSPYNPAFRAHISSAGRVPIPVGYFVFLRPDNRSFLGCGLFAPMFKTATTMIRDHISRNGGEFEEIITAPEFTKHFTVMGEALKNVPSGYDANHVQAEYLKNKSWYLEYPIPDCVVLDADKFICEAVKIFTLMEPFNNFLNRGLKGFQMPERKGPA